MNTIGFKKDVPVFDMNLFYSQDNDQKIGQDMQLPAVHILLNDYKTDYSSGSFQSTGNPLDVALEGEGFFQVETDGGERYTRCGNFVINQDGVLVTSEGYPVSGTGGEISISGENVVINSRGEIFVDGESSGTLKVVIFPNPSHLKKEGNGLYDFLGDKDTIEEGQDTQIKQGSLELSNVNALHEMTKMIDVLRTYEVYQKLIQTLDDISSKSIPFSLDQNLGD